MIALSEDGGKFPGLILPERCRPGPRHGVSPQCTSRNKRSDSRFKRLISSAHINKRRGKAQISRRCYRQLASRVAYLDEMSDEERLQAFACLRRRILHSGYDNYTMLFDALAHACVAAQRTLGLRPREGQCRTALALIFGFYVEMPTGEGKTLATALAGAVIALDGTPVHMLTANDYLAERDAALLAPMYEALGLSSGSVRPDMSEQLRRDTYACDVTHLTGKQAGFDWMRDALSQGPATSPIVTQLGLLADPQKQEPTSLLQRGLCVGILDEADSMLLDEARTPLVLAAPIMVSDELENEASIALALAQMLSPESDFQLRKESREAVLTDTGAQALAHHAKKVPGAWRATRYRNERVRQALVVQHLWHRDHDYVVRDGQVLLVDEQSGRTLPDRRLQHGLHCLLELKEMCEPTPENETVASIAFQSFFLRYVRLVGTSGTLKEVKSELSQTYCSSMVSVPAEKASRLTILPPRVFTSHADQLDALIEEVQGAQTKTRPVLIGTRSVEQSRAVSAMLAAHGFQHNVLDASQDRDEANIIVEAGQSGRITVATNMAGRGTDIPLGEGVARLGGLHLVSLAFNDARRIDRQLMGRTARQGDPGSFRQLWALEDKSLEAAFPSWLKLMVTRWSRFGEFLGVSRGLVLMGIRYAQRRIERRHASERRAALEARRGIASHIDLNGHPEHPV